MIWSLGWCMVLMAGLVFLPLRVVAGAGVAIIPLHNAVMPLLAQRDPRIAAVWLLVVAALYGPCRWFAVLRARRSGSLLRYL